MEIQKKLDELGSAFEEFKKTNDTRLAEIKATGAVKADTETKLAKIETTIVTLEETIKGLNAALARTGGNGGDPTKDEAKEKDAKYREAQLKWMRKGEAIPEELMAHAVSRVTGKSMSADSEVDGGFLVTPETSSEIVTKVFESSPMRQLASAQSISTSSLKILEDLDEAASGWVGERGARPATGTPQIKMNEIFVFELYANPQATQSFLDDASINIESWLAGKVSDKFARDEATAFISGNGVNKPKGILSYGSGNGYGLIERVVTAANNAVVGEDLIDVQTALKEPYQAGAQWMINRSMIGVLRKLKDTVTGQYIWQPGLQISAPSVLLGRPVNMASDLPSAITATTDTILYGDFKAGYQIVDRVGIRVLRDPYTNKPYVGFYTTKRVGGAVKNFEAIKVLKIKT